MKEVTTKAKRANNIAILISIPISLVIISSFWFNYKEESLLKMKEINTLLSLSDNNIIDTIIVVMTPAILITLFMVIHEMIHGVFMLIFSKKRNSVQFGFRKDVFVPFAHCKEILVSWKMLVVILAPWLIIGLIPFVISLINGNLILWFLGFAMTLGAIGDFIYAFLIFKVGLNIKIIDHDKEIGFRMINPE